MVVHMANKESSTMTAAPSDESATPKNGNKLSKKSTLRWRSTGWTPLAYPASALVNNNNHDVTTANRNCGSNPFFPLDKDVIRAAAREMLILEGSIDSKTLMLMKDKPMRFLQSCDAQTTTVYSAPVYARHVKPQLVSVARTKVTVDGALGVAPVKKRKVPASHSRCTSQKKKRKRPATIKSSFETQVPCESEAHSKVHVKELQISVSCAEELVDVIADRARVRNGPCSVIESVSSSSKFEQEEVHHAAHLLRKVSDADQISIIKKTPLLLDLTEEKCGDNDISLFVDIYNRRDDGSFSFLKSEIPSFLDVSIVNESLLRVSAYHMVCKVCHTFHDDSIRLFLGYKSSALKRGRVLRILSDYLFDVSHALFAWKQTEGEILSESIRPSLASFYRQVDSLVSDSLFDQRALKKIGGLDDSSILRHAIEISRCERKHESWHQFSKTATGRRLLLHHWGAGRARLVGQKRRGQRFRRVAPQIPSAAPTVSDSSEDAALPRSRASSIASFDESMVATENQNAGSAPEASTITARRIQDVAAAVAPSPLSPRIQNFSKLLNLTLTRAMGKSWGVLLAKEGDHCVVDRAPDGSILRCGDLILSVRDGNTGQEWKSCPNMNSDWFKEMVGFFKGSYELHLVVRRVGF